MQCGVRRRGCRARWGRQERFTRCRRTDCRWRSQPCYQPAQLAVVIEINLILKGPAHHSHHLVAPQVLPRQCGDPLGELGDPIGHSHADHPNRTTDRHRLHAAVAGRVIDNVVAFPNFAAHLQLWCSRTRERAVKLENPQRVSAAGHVDETAAVKLVCQHYRRRRTASMFAKNQVGFAGAGVVTFKTIRAMQKDYHVGILFLATTFA